MAWTSLGSAGGLAIALPVIAFSFFINMLELLVAFLQAFIFMFLSAIFIGQAVNIHHEHDEHEEESEHAGHGRALAQDWNTRPGMWGSGPRAWNTHWRDTTIISSVPHRMTRD